MPRPRHAHVLDDRQRAALDEGRHEIVAAELSAAGLHAAAAEVHEQIWDFVSAHRCWMAANERVEAARAGIEAARPDLVEAALAAIESAADPEQARAAADLAARRGRHREAARMLAVASGERSVQQRADALVRAGDRLGAARLHADAGQSRDALAVLGPLEERALHVERWALAAKLSWDLGDAEQTARCAQAAMRLGTDDGALPLLLARALGALGHDLAAQIVLRDAGRDTSELAELPGLSGRFHVTAVLPASLTGTAYAGYDRVTLAEVEIHVLLSELAEGEAPRPEVLQALRRFAATAAAANQLGHPAIRPVLRAEPEEGIVVMPRAEGATLRQRIRPPGMAETPARARAMVAFIAEALALAHARGIVHGSLLPSQIVTDALGRPQLGPFGANHLSGLAATRTGSLDELLAVAAPETREGAPPTEASDVYSLGVLYAALVAGELDPAIDDLPEAVAAVVRPMLVHDPAQRPTAEALVETLSAPVADISRVVAERARAEQVLPGAVGPGAHGPETTRDDELGPATELGIPSISVEAAPSWTDELIETLAAIRYPHFQPILDRTGRTLLLASWTEGCKAPAADFDWRSLGERSPLAALDALTEDERIHALRRALLVRMQPSSLVRTPAGDWMLALDDILRR